MLTWVAPLVLVMAVTAAITAKLLVRRRAPEGGWFTDAPRSAGSLSVIGTMFAVMLAFVILLALQSYQRAREGTSVEAIAVSELYSVASVFESPTRDRLQGGGLLHARCDRGRMAGDERGRSSELVKSWIDKLQRSSRTPTRGARQERRTRSGSDRHSAAKVVANAWPRRPLRARSAVVGVGHWPRSRSPTWSPRRIGAKAPIQSIPIGFVTALVTAAMARDFLLAIR